MDTATDTAAAATDAATDTASAAADADGDATEAAGDAASDAVDSAVEAATDATDGTTELASAGDAAADAAATTEAADAAPGLAELLTVDGFDLSKVTEMIDGSSLGALQKTGLKSSLQAAQDNPELLKSALDAVKQALGL